MLERRHAGRQGPARQPCQAHFLELPLQRPLQQSAQRVTEVPARVQAVPHVAPLKPGAHREHAVALVQATQLVGQAVQVALVAVRRQNRPAVHAGVHVSVLQDGRPVRPGAHVEHRVALVVQVALQEGGQSGGSSAGRVRVRGLACGQQHRAASRTSTGQREMHRAAAAGSPVGAAGGADSAGG